YAGFKRERLGFWIQSVRDLRRRRFECLRLTAIEGDEYEKRFRSRRVALVRLQVNEHLPAFTEDPRNARNQLLSVVNQRIRGLCRRSGALVLRGVVESFSHIHALAAQDDRADGDTLVLLHQVRNNEWRLIRSDAAGLRIARKKLNNVFARKQRKAGVIFDWPPRQLAGRFATEFHVHFVAQILNSGAVFILHFADKIDECALGTSGASEHELAPEVPSRSEEHTSELQSRGHLVCRLLLE